MRKFKLVKRYPGSPELGTEVEKQAKSQTYYHIYNDYVDIRKTME